MPPSAARLYFEICRTLGRLLRAGRYSTVRIVSQAGELKVRKQRRWYAPFLVWLGLPVVRILDTGMRVLPQWDWQEREQQLYETLYGTSVRVDAGGTLVLPCLPGDTLANLLENPTLGDQARTKAIELAVEALAGFHARGFTHADAMAENVMVDLERGVAHWFDFETAHDPSRPMDWRRADDVRALLATCLVRTTPEKLAETLQRVLDLYADDDVARFVGASFNSAWQRPLTFHLGQAPVSWQGFREIARLLRERAGKRPLPASNAPRVS